MCAQRPPYSASAPGKVIISGEHFVNYGSYAVAAAIDKRITVTVSPASATCSIHSGSVESRIDENDGKFAVVKAVIRQILSSYRIKSNFRIDIISEIPAGSGLGSSAAVSVACTASLSGYLGMKLDTADIFELAMVGEKVAHGDPSGIDVATSIAGGILLFKRGGVVRQLPAKIPFDLIILFSGSPRNTSELVSKVSEHRKTFPSLFNKLVESSSYASLQIADAITTGELSSVGYFLNFVQCALSWIGVSTNKLDSMLDVVLKDKDCIGAKITGAGGGGSLFGLTEAGKGTAILERISKNHEFAFISRAPMGGLVHGMTPH